MAYLACVIVRDQDVPCCQVSVDKGLVGEVGHARGHLAAVVKEGAVIYIHFFIPHFEKIVNGTSTATMESLHATNTQAVLPSKSKIIVYKKIHNPVGYSDTTVDYSMMNLDILFDAQNIVSILTRDSRDV